MALDDHTAADIGTYARLARILSNQQTPWVGVNSPALKRAAELILKRRAAGLKRIDKGQSIWGLTIEPRRRN